MTTSEPGPHSVNEAAQEDAIREAQVGERWRLLRALDSMMEGPLVVLSLVWLGLLVIELLGTTDARIELVVYVIWAIFIAEVVIKLIIAPDRPAWLRGNWLKLVSLALPALRVLRVLRVLRILRAARVVRSASLLRLLTSLNRGFGALGRTLDRARFAYVVAISALVVVVVAAGMLFFEGTAVAPPGGASVIDSYGEALWWTAMTLTTVGSEYSPVTPEGRFLAFLLAVYAVAVFGYVTATIASHFLGLGRDEARAAAGVDTADLRQEIASLRAQLALLSEQLGEQRRPAD